MSQTNAGFRSRAALLALTGEDLNRAVTALDESRAEYVARRMRIPVSDLRTNARVNVIVRRRLAGKSREFVVDSAEALAGGPLDVVVTALGDRSDDPSLNELSAAISAALDTFGARLASLVLAVGVDRGYRAAPHCAQLLDCDERLTASPDEPATQGEPGYSADDDRAATVAARRARKQARAAERSAQRSVGHPRYRRARSAPPACETSPADAAPPFSSTLAPAPARRVIRPDRAIRDLRLDEPLIGSVVFAPIRFGGPDVGIKDRPCVVIAAAGPRHLVVRPCYSEGGFRTRTWRSVEIQDLKRAGLHRGTWVSSDEHVIRRADVKQQFGTLSVSDWNML